MGKNTVITVFKVELYIYIYIEKMHFKNENYLGKGGLNKYGSIAVIITPNETEKERIKDFLEEYVREHKSIDDERLLGYMGGRGRGEDEPEGGGEPPELDYSKPLQITIDGSGSYTKKGNEVAWIIRNGEYNSLEEFLRSKRFNFEILEIVEGHDNFLVHNDKIIKGWDDEDEEAYDQLYGIIADYLMDLDKLDPDVKELAEEIGVNFTDNKKLNEEDKKLLDSWENLLMDEIGTYLPEDIIGFFLEGEPERLPTREEMLVMVKEQDGQDLASRILAEMVRDEMDKIIKQIKQTKQLNKKFTYPKDIKNCSKGKKQGGIPIKEFRKLAREMGIDTKGLKKAEICKKIEKILGK